MKKNVTKQFTDYAEDEFEMAIVDLYMRFNKAGYFIYRDDKGEVELVAISMLSDGIYAITEKIIDKYKDKEEFTL